MASSCLASFVAACEAQHGSTLSPTAAPEMGNNFSSQSCWVLPVLKMPWPITSPMIMQMKSSTE